MANERPSAAAVRRAPCRPIVLDTNIVLDLLVFADAATVPLRRALDAGTLDWIATPPMREELARVLGYPQIVPRLAFYGLSAADVLAGFDGAVRGVAVAPKAGVTCKDADDQKFIDLAAAHQAYLLSKDHAVLSMKNRLLALGSSVGIAIQNIAEDGRVFAVTMR